MAIAVDDPLWQQLFESRSALLPSCVEDGVPTQSVGVVGGSTPPDGLGWRCTHCMTFHTGDPAESLAEGNVMCPTCATVASRQIDYGAEWRYFCSDDNRSFNPTRCCPSNQSSTVQQLGSIVSCAPRKMPSQWTRRTEQTADNASLVAAAGKSVQRFQTWTALSYRERVLCSIFDNMSSVLTLNGVPACILEDAKHLYRQATSSRITRGENREAVIAVSVYYACKRSRVPRSIKEIGEMFNVRTTSLTKACRLFADALPDVEDAAAASCAVDYTSRFCCRLGLDREVVSQVREVVRRIDLSQMICDAMPTSIVAGAILYCTRTSGVKGEPSAADVAKTCMVAAATATKMLRRIRETSEGWGGVKEE